MSDNKYKLQGAAAIHAEMCTLMERTFEPDNGGGSVTSWSDGIKFQAALNSDNSHEAKVANAHDTKSTFIIAVHKDMPIKFDDHFRVDNNNFYIKVTSDPTATQTHSNFPIQEKQFTGEYIKKLPR